MGLDQPAESMCNLRIRPAVPTGTMPSPGRACPGHSLGGLWLTVAAVSTSGSMGAGRSRRCPATVMAIIHSAQ